MPTGSQPVRIRDLFLNYVSLVGGIAIGIGFVTDLFLIIVDLLVPSHNPYVGILTYMLVPAGIVLGIGLALAGAAIRYVQLRRGREFLVLPHLDLNTPRHRFILGAVFTILILFLGLSAVAGYQAYHFTDSVQFCGQACHAVMNPEFTAYQQSPHARVACASCHIGPGAEWFVRSKLSGTYQIYSVFFNKYPRPIPTPIHNLRPAQADMRAVSLAGQVLGRAALRTQVHFSSDERNTRREVNLLIEDRRRRSRRSGDSLAHEHPRTRSGTSPRTSGGRSSPGCVRRTATAASRSTCPRTTLSRPEQRKQGQMRLMDCVDCHNRPSHRYLPPSRAIDLSLEAKRIPIDLPFIKKVAVEAMVRRRMPPPPRPTRESSGRSGPSTRRNTRPWRRSYPQRVRLAIEEVQRVYRHNFFPEMRVSWEAYPDNLGHKEFPGCFRCHDGKHVNGDGQPLSRRCNVCHDFLQTSTTGFQRVEATPAFAHPWQLAGKHATIMCSSCHTGGPAKPATCRGCHKLPESGTPMASLQCSQCHQKDQQVQPVANCLSCHGDRGALHKAATHSAAGCTTCHVPHTWVPFARETCLTCHADKAQHNPGPACTQCHAFRTQGTAAAPPAITFASAKDAPGPVTFTHASHLARGAKCADCHPGLFKMQKGGISLTMEAMAGGKACGACHNGKKAFEVMDGDKCTTCHKQQS